MGLISKLKDMMSGTQVDYNELIDKGAIVVDVRSQQEFNSGHIEGSKNYPIGEFSNHLAKMKNKTVILVCLSGGRAGSAKSILEQNGIECYNAGGWRNLK
jgi:rhodanese-related sulfurtransferase